jgi:hypothetical protein
MVTVNALVVGEKFGRWTIVGPPEKRGQNQQIYHACRCDCGAERHVKRASLMRRESASCGCAKADAARKRLTKHGRTDSPEYLAWLLMRRRCHEPRDNSYHRYGARGISVAKEWRDSFEAFFAHVGPRPSDEYSLERKDNNGNYEPGNVRWATATEQARNRRSSHFVTFNGETLTIAAWANKTGLPRMTLLNRLVRLGWPVERAMQPHRTPPSSR